MHVHHAHAQPPGPLPRRPLPYHRPTKDVLLFRPQEQATRDRLLPRWNPPRLYQMANHRCVGRVVRFPQPFRVRACLLACTGAFLHHPRNRRFSPPTFFGSRDFFPVIITFLRQLPFIGQFLNLPFIRPVRHLSVASYLAYVTLTLTRATVTRLSSWIV